MVLVMISIYSLRARRRIFSMSLDSVHLLFPTVEMAKLASAVHQNVPTQSQAYGIPLPLADTCPRH